MVKSRNIEPGSKIRRVGSSGDFFNVITVGSRGVYIHNHHEKTDVVYPLDEFQGPNYKWETNLGNYAAYESNNYGYHKRKIKKGVLGELSKIREEFEELEDALAQNNPVMSLVELSDLVGAIEAYIENNHKITLEQLLNMTKATKRAFQNGDRK